MSECSEQKKRIVIGAAAHVDAGKTTLSEALLLKAGAIRKAGRVDNGDSVLDTHEAERGRGITVFSHRAEFETDSSIITLIDTPGHVDFSCETERVLNILDHALLIISASDGVQSHTVTLWKLLRKLGIPSTIFINKTDLATADKSAALTDIKNRLSEACVDFDGIGSEEFFEECAMLDDTAAEEYLTDGKISDDTLARAVSAGKIFPCLSGSALKMRGVDSLIEYIDKYILPPERADMFGARIYKISSDEKNRKLTHMKITGGRLQVRDSISYMGSDCRLHEEKISEIRFYTGEKFRSADTAQAGDVCAAAGLTASYAGKGLGYENDPAPPMLEPVMKYSVELPPEADIHKMFDALIQLTREEPSLGAELDSSVGKITVKLMGEVQLEILADIIKERTGTAVSFGQGSVAYKETIAAPVEGVGHYEPLKHYAEVHLLLEPLERGSGLVFECDCAESLEPNFQRLVMTHLKEKTHKGVLTGSPITDMRITLRSGRSHIKHTEGGDFRQAVYRAVRQGLRSAESILLEPVYDITMILPTENAGRAISDIQRMNGEMQPPVTDGENTVIKCRCPAAKMNGYQRELSAYTSGKGRMFLSFGGYTECAEPQKVIDETAYDCDGDLENTADSVFCSHGAGYNVRWDKVNEYMHLPSILKKREDTQDRPFTVRKSFQALQAEDKELEEIFERTYGAPKRDRRKAFEPVKKTAVQYKSKPYVRPDKEYLLVDGYNIIFAWEELKKLADQSIDLARSRLINIMSSYQGYKRCELIIVFDAYKVSGSRREIEQEGHVSIIYTKEHETADSYIERAARGIARSENARVRVATSDGLEQVIIMGGGALRMSASELLEEVKAAKNSAEKYLDKRRS